MSLFGELKRRNVFRVGIAYLAAVWVLIQVADTVLPVANAPSWILQALLFSSALGFPLTLVLAWFYELTPDGIKATADLEAMKPVKFMGRKLDFAIIGLLVVAVGFLVVANYVVEERERSIAALPFANDSEAEENAEFFADGIHDELLTQLAKLSSLKVISRTSVMEYRDSPKSMREIGRELGVATLLEGRVQRAGDMVRINVQLIDSETGENLWAEVYNRELSAENIFTIQSEMATSIAGALRAALSPQEVARLNKTLTENTRAYDSYLLGNAYMTRNPNREWTPRAVQMYQRAVDEDSEFAAAWAALSVAHMVMHYIYIDRTDSRLRMAEQAFEQALELAPDLPEVHMAMGRYYFGLGDNEKALEEYAIAEQGLPGDARLLRRQALVYWDRGEIEQAADRRARALELDPFNVELLTSQAQTYLMLRDYPQVNRLYERALDIRPDLLAVYLNKDAWLPLVRDGDFAAVRAALARPPLYTPERRNGRQLGVGWLAALYAGDYDSALEYANAMVDIMRTPYFYAPKALFLGAIYLLDDQVELAEPQFQVAREQIESALANNRQDFRLYVALGAVMVGLDDPDAALGNARQAIELLPASADIRQWARYDLITKVLAPAGLNDDAIEQLDAYLTEPGEWSIEGLLPDPRLNPIQGDPRFQDLVDKYRR